MTLDPEKLLTLAPPTVRQSWTARDSMLYALGIGMGAEPTDPGQLRFVYEEGLRAVPTMAAVLGYPGFFLRDPALGLDWTRILHGEQRIMLHRPLPAEGSVEGTTRIVDVVDKGARTGALLFTERRIGEAGKDGRLATLLSTVVCRGDGGFGGRDGPVPPPHALPDRAPDSICDLAVPTQAALLYRLSGDRNPLHADPEVARAAGFDRPILHGLCTLGVAAHAILRTVCGYDPDRLVDIATRFRAPVFPGETVRTEIWRTGEILSFRATVPARDVTVLDNGRAEVSGRFPPPPDG